MNHSNKGRVISVGPVYTIVQPDVVDWMNTKVYYIPIGRSLNAKEGDLVMVQYQYTSMSGDEFAITEIVK